MFSYATGEAKIISQPVLITIWQKRFCTSVCINTEVLLNQANKAVQITFSRRWLSGQQFSVSTVPSQAQLLGSMRGTLQEKGASSAKAAWLQAAGSPPCGSQKRLLPRQSSAGAAREEVRKQGAAEGWQAGQRRSSGSGAGGERPPGCRRAVPERHFGAVSARCPPARRSARGEPFPGAAGSPARAHPTAEPFCRPGAACGARTSPHG